MTLQRRYFSGDRRASARSIVAGLAFAVLSNCPFPAMAVDYMQICYVYGDYRFYIPGTNTCQNANQIASNQFDIAREFSRAMTGMAMSAALVAPFVPDNANSAISVHWATFDDKTAFGAGLTRRLAGNLFLTGGVAFGVDRGSVVIATKQQTSAGTYSPVLGWSSVDVLARLGLDYSW